MYVCCINAVSDSQTDRLGTVLVALQLALLTVLAWQGLGGLLHGPIVPDALVFAAAGIIVGVWALSANRPGNFNIRPVPREGGRLVEHGPYRWIRHPMYAALMLAGVAAARLASEATAWLALAALVAVLVVKAGVEERAMLASHPGYAAYRRRTRRFVPWVF